MRINIYRDPYIKEPCGVSTLSTRSKEPYLRYRAYLGAQANPLQSKQVFWTSCGFSASAPARALLSFIFKTNALNIVMVRLVDAAGNNVTDYRADQPWEVLISAAAEGGEDLIMAQPDLCTRAGTDLISIKYVDFAGRLIAPYLLVDENEDEKFFHYLPDSAALATPWSELRAGMTDWSQTSSSTFQERLDGVFAKADKTQFEWRTGFSD